jgi:hypothetical protein
MVLVVSILTSWLATLLSPFSGDEPLSLDLTTWMAESLLYRYLDYPSLMETRREAGFTGFHRGPAWSILERNHRTRGIGPSIYGISRSSLQLHPI